MKVLVLLAILFIGARAYNRGADRASCILNQRNVQQAVRTYQNINELQPGAPIPWDEVVGDGEKAFMKKPTCPDGGNYTFSATIPAIGVQAVTCSHAPNQNHVPKDVAGW